MKLFAISDQHYGHENIIKYCSRKVQGAKYDAARMIQAHNEVVNDEDMVIFVGDVSCSAQGREWLPSILKRLKGRKILVRGNHDHLKDEEYKEIGFEQVHEILMWQDPEDGDNGYVFCHYPDNSDAIQLSKHKGFKLVCGHTHKPFKDYGDGVERINVAVDVMGLKPKQLV